jgi:hypothetical protein
LQDSNYHDDQDHQKKQVDETPNGGDGRHKRAQYPQNKQNNDDRFKHDMLLGFGTSELPRRWSETHDNQDEARDHGNDPHDRVENDGMWLLHVDLEEPGIRNALGREVGESRNGESNDAEDDQDYAKHNKWFHGQCPVD